MPLGDIGRDRVDLGPKSKHWVILGKIEKHLLLSVFFYFETMNFFYSFAWCNDEHDQGSISVGLRDLY